jgi:hypothetical protein
MGMSEFYGAGDAPPAQFRIGTAVRGRICAQQPEQQVRLADDQPLQERAEGKPSLGQLGRLLLRGDAGLLLEAL